MVLTPYILILEIPLYFFHVSVFILLFFKRKYAFQGSFYNVFRIILITDILVFLVWVTVQRIPLIPSFAEYYKNNHVFATFIFNSQTFFTVIQFVGHTIMAFNRFTILWLPLKHKLIWSRQWYTFVLIGFPFLYVSWKLHELGAFIFNINGTVSFVLTNPWIMYLHSLITPIIYFATTLAAAILNLLSFIKFYFYKQTPTTININEKNLLFLSFIVMLAQLLRTCYSTIILFPVSENIREANRTLGPLFIDIFALSGSLSLLILSKTTRQEYMTFYFCKNSHTLISASGGTVPPV